jgi:uncharacterized protein (DUF58 family)
MSKTPTLAASEKVFINLKNLINLAKPAASLKLKRHAIRAQQSGGYGSKFKSRGMEFEEVRAYQAGDDVRNIDWKVTARTGEVQTKVFREERERPIFISVDARATMHFATRGVFKSVLAAQLAGLLAWAAQHQGDRIGGQLFSDFNCQELKPQNGKHAVLRFLNLLSSQYQAKSNAGISLEHVLARLVQHARAGSLVYIISDFRGINDMTEQHLTRLARHCEVVLVFIFDPLEDSLPSKGRYRFTNGDNDVVVDASDQQRLLTYHLHFQQRQQRLQQLAKNKGLSFIQCSTSDDPIQCLR